MYITVVMYFSEHEILVYRLPEDGAVPPKHAAVNKAQFLCTLAMDMLVFYK